MAGNTYGGNPVLPEDEREVHPLYPHLDKQGHPLKGVSLNGGLGPVGNKPSTIPHAVHALKLELLNCVNADDIRQVYGKLLALTQTAEHGAGVQLDAIKLYLERFFGKPSQEMHIQQKTTTTKVNVDLTALSDDELRTYMQLQGKVQTLALEEKRSDEIVIEGEK